MNFEIRNKFFSNRNVKTWNKLPNNIKDAPNLKLFKSFYDKTWMEMWIIINQRTLLIFYLKYPGVTNTNKQTNLPCTRIPVYTILASWKILM